MYRKKDMKNVRKNPKSAYIDLFDCERCSPGVERTTARKKNQTLSISPRKFMGIGRRQRATKDKVESAFVPSALHIDFYIRKASSDYEINLFANCLRSTRSTRVEKKSRKEFSSYNLTSADMGKLMDGHYITNPWYTRLMRPFIIDKRKCKMANYD